VTRAVALTALITLLLAGCGGSGADGAAGADSAIDLKLTLWPNGETGDSITWTLRCDPPGGDHPAPEAACAAAIAGSCVSCRWDRIAPVFPTGS
jgi:hypothetical protein